MEKPGYAKFTPERKTKVRCRMQDGYTFENIIQAICGCSVSRHHMGENDRDTKYDDLTLICRNGSKLEWFMEMTTAEAANETYRRFEKETGIGREGDFPKLVHSGTGGNFPEEGD